MKRQISILACVLMLLAIVFAVASCSQPEAAHVHEYAEFVSKEATCTEKGEVTLTCACGDKYTNETAAKGHNLAPIAAVEPTCTTEGKTEGVQCTDCGLITVAQTTIAPIGHNLGAAATCTTAQTCELCDHVFVEALGHNAPAPTCTEDSVCKRCGEKQKSALGHKPINDATCTEASICGVCDEVVAEALGHTYPSDCYSGVCQVCSADDSYVEGNGAHEYDYLCSMMCNKCWDFTNMEAQCNMIEVEAKASTCTEHGNVKYSYCEYCGYCEDENGYFTNMMNVKLPLAEHEYLYECDHICMNCLQETNTEAEHSITHVEAKAPTCTEIGNIEFWYCEFCGYCWADADLTRVTNMKSVKLPANGHSYEFDCDQYCEVCGELTREDAEHLLDHSDAVAPTCTKTGNIEFDTCEYCLLMWDANGDLITDPTIPANGHKYEVACDPVCLVCSFVNTEAAHNVVKVTKKAATCTADGAKVDYWYCSYCELCWVDEACTLNTNMANVVIPAFGHKGHDYDLKCDVCNLYLLPEFGVAVKLGMYQANASNKTYYITGKIASSYYYGTTTNVYSSPDVFLEKANDNGGFYMYLMNGTTKQYLYVAASGTHNNPKFGTTKGLFTLDAKTGALVTTSGSNGQVFLGNYGTYTSITASKISYISGSSASNVDKSQFLLRMEILKPHDCQMSEATCSKAPTCSICGKVEGSKLPHTPGPEATCTAAQTCTVCNATIVAKLAHTGGTATCTEKAKCDVCGTAYGSLGDHTEPNAQGKCDVCGETISEVVVPTITSTKFDFSTLTTKNTTAMTASAVLTLFKNYASNDSGLTNVTTASYVYQGNGDGGKFPNQSGMIKMGKSSTDGKLVLTFDRKVTKVVITCYAWNDGKTDKVGVNNSTQVTAPNSGSYGELTFTITASDTVTIVTNDRVFIQSIEVFYE